jgi:hypothetical protein
MRRADLLVLPASGLNPQNPLNNKLNAVEAMVANGWGVGCACLRSDEHGGYAE